LACPEKKNALHRLKTSEKQVEKKVKGAVRPSVINQVNWDNDHINIVST